MFYVVIDMYRNEKKMTYELINVVNIDIAKDIIYLMNVFQFQNKEKISEEMIRNFDFEDEWSSIEIKLLKELQALELSNLNSLIYWINWVFLIKNILNWINNIYYPIMKKTYKITKYRNTKIKVVKINEIAKNDKKYRREVRKINFNALINLFEDNFEYIKTNSKSKIKMKKSINKNFIIHESRLYFYSSSKNQIKDFVTYENLSKIFEKELFQIWKFLNNQNERIKLK